MTVMILSSSVYDPQIITIILFTQFSLYFWYIVLKYVKTKDEQNRRTESEGVYLVARHNLQNWKIDHKGFDPRNSPNGQRLIHELAEAHRNCKKLNPTFKPSNVSDALVKLFPDVRGFG